MNDDPPTRSTFSFVVPVRNQAAQIGDLYKRLAAEADALGEPVELIFVDDGSTDQTVASLHRISDGDPRVRYVELSGRFGRPAAVTAGCHLATGHAVITFDRRCKDWPEVLSRLLGRWREGAEVVHAGGRAPGQAGGVWTSLKRMWFGGQMRPSGAHMRLIVDAAASAMRTDGSVAVTIDQQIEWIGFKQAAAVGSSKPRRAERAVNCDRPYELSAARYVLPIATGVLAIAVACYVVLLVLRAFDINSGVEPRLTVLVVALASFYIAAAALWRRSAGAGDGATRARPAYIVRRAVGFDRPAAPQAQDVSETERGGYVVYT